MIVARVRRASRIASAAARRSPETSVMSDASIAALLALGFLFCAMTFAWLTFYAIAVARLGRLLTGSVKRALDAVTGLVLIALGLRLATEDR